MYRLDPKVVKPGCTLKRLIEYRKETGLFSGDVDSYVQKILDAMTQGTSRHITSKQAMAASCLPRTNLWQEAAGSPRTRT